MDYMSEEIKTRTFIPYGDKELWVAKAKDDSWSLPLIVEWMYEKESDTHYGSVWPPFCPYVSQSLRFKALLDFHNESNRDDRWVVRKDMIEVLLVKAEGITPSFYYKWPDDNCPMIPNGMQPKQYVRTGHVEDDARRPMGGVQEDFVNQVCMEHKLKGSIVRLVMRAVMAEAPKWMIEQRQALNLGFCKLVALPFRPNWKEIVSFKFRKFKLLGIFNMSSKVRREQLEEIGMPEALCSTHNVAIKNPGGFSSYRVSYVIEAIPTKAFDKAADMIEQRRAMCGKTSYVASFEKTVEKLYDHILDSLEVYVRKAFMPFARICESIHSGRLWFTPTYGVKDRRVRGTDLRKIPVRIMEAGTNFSALAERRAELLVREKAPKVQKVPAVLQEANDVRGCDVNGVVGQQREEGVAGLPVCDAGQGEATGQPVLSVDKNGAGIASWVD